MKYSVTFYLFLFGLIAILVGWYASSSRSSSVLSLAPQKTTSSVMGTAATPTQSNTPTTIVKVIDGDTVVTNNGKKIRYIGINAPEIGQLFAKEAADLNTHLVLDKQVQIVFDTQKTDQYGRELAYVFVQNHLVNAEIVGNGLAVADPIVPNILHQNEIDKAEQVAKNQCLGIWQSYCTASKTSCIKIAMIHYDAKGVDDTNLNDEWVTIQNSCSQGINMQNWYLKDTSSSNIYIFKNNTISAQQIITLRSGCGQDTGADFYWKCPAVSHAIWNNTGDEAMLFDSHGELLSVYKY